MTGSGFPGESAGLLNDAVALAQDRAGDDFLWLRLVGHAAAACARVRDSRRRRRQASGDAASRRRPVPGERVIDERVARELLQMMESVVSQDGTRRARGAGRLSRRRQNRHGVDSGDAGGYSTERYKAYVRRRRAREPSAARRDRRDRRARRQLYYGGDVAAPVFANVMAGALRLLGVPPDGLDRLPTTTLVQASREP